MEGCSALNNFSSIESMCCMGLSCFIFGRSLCLQRQFAWVIYVEFCGITFVVTALNWGHTTTANFIFQFSRFKCFNLGRHMIMDWKTSIVALPRNMFKWCRVPSLFWLEPQGLSWCVLVWVCAVGAALGLFLHVEVRRTSNFIFWWRMMICLYESQSMAVLAVPSDNKKRAKTDATLQDWNVAHWSMAFLSLFVFLSYAFFSLF